MSIFKEKKEEKINNLLKQVKDEIWTYLDKTENFNILSSEMGFISVSRLRLLYTKPQSFYSLSIANMITLYDYIKLNPIK
nr:MAG TPA: hypothetical protein [Caudoviricetes sp.]